MNPQSVFVTGANRGIGLALVRELLTLKPKYIFAACRDPAKAQELTDLAKENSNVKVVKIDVTDKKSYGPAIAQVTQLVGEAGLNLLVNNAGLMKVLSLTDVTAEDLREHFEVNTIAPVILTQALLPLLKKAAQASGAPGLSCSKAAVVNFSSKVGSITDNGGGGSYAYRAAKAALNICTVSMAVDLKKEGILAASLHPGWVKTDLGGPNALIDTTQCVQGLVKVMSGLDETSTGSFKDYKGETIPW